MAVYEGSRLAEAELIERTNITPLELSELIKPLFLFMHKHGVADVHLFRDGMKAKLLANFQTDEQRFEKLERLGASPADKPDHGGNRNARIESEAGGANSDRG